MKNTAFTARNITAIVIGNALEWYDFVIYSFMTIVIAKLFFPAVEVTNSLLAATATFGVAFCMRPLGGIMLGIYSDKHGRKAAITLVIGIMSVALLIISFAPTYKMIGLAAPMLIVFARLLQGFSAGGEFGVSTSVLIELAPRHQRGYYGSWQMAGQMLAILLGTLIGLIVTTVLTQDQLEFYGWRIPFMLGLVIAPVGMYLRSHLQETNPHAMQVNGQRSALWATMRTHWRQVLVAMGLVVGGTVAVYVNISYLPTFAVTYLQLTMSDAFISVGVAMLLMIMLIPFFGHLSDSIGRRPILLVALSLYLFCVYPLFLWLTLTPTFVKLITVEVCLCLLLSAYFGVFAAAVAGLFPVAIRSSGLGISYNLVVMLFGGFAQFIVTGLIVLLKTPMAIAYYLMFAILISLVSAIFYHEEKKD